MQEACACAIRMLLENEIEKFPIDLKNIKQYQGNRTPHIILKYPNISHILKNRVAFRVAFLY